ncbi:hypothetical protein C5167_012628 [Papaver somniferum]|uniref:Uncharacterized protein n=1 Tax=Papaver somniferum TaxID=3469 RepID=A0A4Y7J1Y7_PAPSO|nr:hypothetical protein C5167_012628 [Papaver somniferum]
MGSSSNAPTQTARLLNLGHFLPIWDLQMPILGTSNVVTIEEGPFDREDVIGLTLPSDIPEVPKVLQEYLFLLVDSRDRLLNLAVNDMYIWDHVVK